MICFFLSFIVRFGCFSLSIKVFFVLIVLFFLQKDGVYEDEGIGDDSAKGTEVFAIFPGSFMNFAYYIAFDQDSKKP